MTRSQWIDATSESNAGGITHTGRKHLALLFAAMSIATSPDAESMPVDRIGVCVVPPLAPTGQTSKVQSEISMTTLMAGLQHFAQRLAASQIELDKDDKRLLYSNLWDLYDPTE